MVRGVDHRRRLVQKDDLVDVLDLAGVEHDLLPSTTCIPAFWSSKNIAVSARSTPSGIFATPASRRNDAISSAWRCIRPAAGGTVPRMRGMPALTLFGTSQSQ